MLVCSWEKPSNTKPILLKALGILCTWLNTVLKVKSRMFLWVLQVQYLLSGHGLHTIMKSINCKLGPSVLWFLCGARDWQPCGGRVLSSRYVAFPGNSMSSAPAITWCFLGPDSSRQGISPIEMGRMPFYLFHHFVDFVINQGQDNPWLFSVNNHAPSIWLWSWRRQRSTLRL